MLISGSKDVPCGIVCTNMRLFLVAVEYKQTPLDISMSTQF